MLVLHVGPHKTATTWLQHNFYHNIKALEQARWFYPQTGVRVRVAHHDISDHPDQVLNERSAKVRELKRIAARAGERNLNILLSSEGFRNWKPEHLRKLQAIMAPHEMHIVYCVRDPASMLYSFWAQQVKTGTQLSFPEFSDRQFAKPARSRILNPLLEIKALSELDGARLSLLLYDEIRRQKRDIFDVFVADLLQIAPLPHAEEAVSNDRQPLEMTEFMRLILIRIGTWKQDADVNIGRVFHYMLGKRKRQQIVEAVAAVNDARRVALIDRNRPIFGRVERELLADYHSVMVPQPSSNRLFLEGAEECPYYDGTVLEADPKVARLLDSVANTFRPGGLHLWVMNWSRFWLSLYRRIVKLLRG
ncbi:MAG: hypothetical protein JWM58_1347 [Rhizobium sp.]|nr:hypothetical protein [Rhizobium sp.]